MLAHAMKNLRGSDYDLVGHIHDEAFGEVDEGKGSEAEFEGLVAGKPWWAEGCPVTTEAFRVKRYRKM